MAVPQYNLGSKMNRPTGRNPVGPPNIGTSTTIVTGPNAPGVPKNGPNTSRVAPARMSNPVMPTTPTRQGPMPTGRGNGPGGTGVNPTPKFGGSGKFKYKSNMGAQKFTPSRERTIA